MAGLVETNNRSTPNPSPPSPPAGAPCQFTTFKSSPTGFHEITGSVTPDPTKSLDLSTLTLGHREISRNTTDITNSARSRNYYQGMVQPRDASPNREPRHLDKQSYFFHGHKTEKDVDHPDVLVYGADVPATSRSFLVETIRSQEKESSEYRGDTAENVEFLEKEGEIFRKSSTEFLQDSNPSRKRNFSFRSKEKTHRSLESLERSVDFLGVDARSLDLLPEDRPKNIFHGKQRSLDSSQKSKKSNDSLNKARKRLGFFQRMGRNLHFIGRNRNEPRSQDFLRSNEDRPSTGGDYLQTGQEKCEYFLQRHRKDLNFFECAPDHPPNGRGQGESDSFHERDNRNHQKVHADVAPPFRVAESVQREPNRPDVKTQEGSTPKDNSTLVPAEDQKSRRPDDDHLSNPESEIGFLGREASLATQETTSGNKDSLEIGYSISQLGRLHTQSLRASNQQPDGLPYVDIIDFDKREHYLNWIARADLDALSRGTNSSDSLGNAKPQGNLDILKGILLDLFVCICI
ncbi:uncharacterized protein LOC112493933 [Cephus cinctus]|uniref:Uncharacterized protein LOC112493933 n=1 Tax=Cephus cinctus TaxID=211228 RepID=A0AAJ7VYL4_CEPCN|nr:uncharacterized protein LOC112493933 [Cephus cinctus]